MDHRGILKYVDDRRRLPAVHNLLTTKRLDEGNQA